VAKRYKEESDRIPEFTRDPEARPFLAKSTAIVFGLLVVAISVTCVVKAVPEYRKLQQVEIELADTLDQERKLEREHRNYELQSASLKTNHRESRARDRLYLQEPGEQVIQLD